MADTGRLDELKRKFDENPRRYFAPLANEYRKAGEPEIAIELCRTYLPQQPSHMSGYIVYGQALHDSGQTDESAAVFKQALALDPENVIALRQLGDIARTSGNSADAVRWYGKVLELDPRNEEVASFITAITNPDAAAQPQTAPERPAPPTVRPEPEPDASAVRLEDIFSEPDMQQLRIMADEPARGAQPEPHTEEESDQPFEVTEWPSALSAESSDDEEESDSPDSSADAPNDGVLEGPWHSTMTQEFEVQEQSTSATTRGASEVGSLRLSDFMPDDSAAFAPVSEELGEPAAEEAPVTDPESAPASQAAQAPQVAQAPQAAQAPDSAPPKELPRAESPFVTETMAELYVKQGHRGEALAVYRQLVVRRNDPELHKRILELEAEERGATPAAGPRETVREFFARIGAVTPNERVVLAVDRGSQLSTLFASTQPDAGDVAAAERLSGAFGDGRTGSSRS